MGICNHCSLKQIRKDAKGTGVRILTRPAGPPLYGTNVYRVPKGDKLDASEESPQFVAWYMKVGDKCEC